MKILGDFHTHTTFSHGKGTVLENAQSAKKQGLSAIAITDHGFGHILYGMDKSRIPLLKKEIELAKAKTGIEILLGVEANFCGLDGQIDLSPDDLKLFDVILLGQHRFVKSSLKTKLKFFLPNMLGIKSKALQEINTKVITTAMEKYPIDVLTHLKHHMPINLKEVALKAVETHTMIELNASKMLFTDEEIKMMVEMGVTFIVNSDAHTPLNVGKVQNVLEIIEKLGVPQTQVANLGKLPKFKAEK